MRTLGKLATLDEGWLRKTFGKRGPELKERAIGIDYSQVAPCRETKSVSEETTMPEDVGDQSLLLEIMKQLATGVAAWLSEQGLMGRTISLKLRLADFPTLTRQTTFRIPTNDVEDIARAAAILLGREIGPGKEVRLVGVGVANLASSFQLPLFPLDEEE